MQVVIFCGGKGTRLREETEYHPKPMIRIGGQPILWHIMKLYAHHGFTDFILCLGYKQTSIREYFLNYRYMSSDVRVELGGSGGVHVLGNHEEHWNVTLIDTGLDTKKGDRLRMIEPHVTGDDFLLTYGDGVADVDVQALLRYHHEEGKLVTFTGVHPISRFATVSTDEQGEIVDWTEKAQLEGHINGGFFVVKREVLASIEHDCEFEEEPMRRLARESQVGMYRHEGFWHCMDTYRDYLVLEGIWRSKDCPWRVWDDQ